MFVLLSLQGNVTISNDGATIMKKLEIVHPAAKVLVDISLSQDAEVGSCRPHVQQLLQ
jgi:T-complex protein 1 subunit eta